AAFRQHGGTAQQHAQAIAALRQLLEQILADEARGAGKRHEWLERLFLSLWRGVTHTAPPKCVFANCGFTALLHNHLGARASPSATPSPKVAAPSTRTRKIPESSTPTPNALPTAAVATSAERPNNASKLPDTIINSRSMPASPVE